MNGPYEDITKEHEEEEDNDDDNNDNVTIHAPNVLANIQLAKQSVSGYMSLASFSNIFNPISTLSLP